jgi:hypothetical protein
MPQRRSMSRRASASTAPRSTPITSMLPERFGIKPMMVRISTDLPAPDGPTKPRISPFRTSRSSFSRISRSPKPTVSCDTRIM